MVMDIMFMVYQYVGHFIYQFFFKTCINTRGYFLPRSLYVYLLLVVWNSLYKSYNSDGMNAHHF